MSAALTYRPSSRRRIAFAFALAILVHFVAVIAAERSQPVPIAAQPPGRLVDIDVTEEVPPAEAPTADELPPSSPPAPEPMEEVFAETEPPRRLPPRSTTRVAPLPRQARPSSRAASMNTARVLALVAPRPDYPYEARRQHLTGSGVALLNVDFASGTVLDVTMVRSTGSAVLDNATTVAFRRWRFKPGTVTNVQTPITFTLTGATY